MLLKEHLEEYTKTQLLEYARGFEISKCSGLRKAALIERIIEGFCSEEMLRNRLACLTDEQLSIFRKACDEPQEISLNEVMDGMQMYMYWLGGFEEITDKFSVYEEVATVFKRIDDDEFKSDQYKKGWLMKCVHFFIDYYGIAPMEVIYELYRLKHKDRIEEMVDMLYEMPIDMTESSIYPVEMLELYKGPIHDAFYSEDGVLVHLPLLQDDELGYLLESQWDKDFYIPSLQQLEEICGKGYEESSLAYGKLKTFFIKKLDLPYEKAGSWCVQVWNNSCLGESPTDIIRDMEEADIICYSEKDANEFIGLLMDAHNNTRLKENRGHKPIEIRRGFSAGMPTIVPGSSHAAEMLRELAPELKEMGVPVDIDGNADTIPSAIYPNGLGGKAVTVEKKVYPNDQCPCGSGMKYKKCCGRK